jgi:hypothetical protein
MESMLSLRAIVSSGFAATLLISGFSVSAQTAEIQKTLNAKYALTKPTADRSDIVTAGDVIVLQKDGLLMCGVTVSSPSQNTYKNGKITQNLLTKSRFGSFSGMMGAAGGGATRTFVSGEKFWITNIETKDDGVVFTLISDPINDVRYYSNIKFPFTKGSPPPAAELASEADQVFKVQPADDAAGGGDSGGGGKGKPPAPGAKAVAAPAPAAEPAPAALAPIAPPPPPPDAAPATPPTISVGLTRAQVTAMFGAPTKVVKLATKEIDYYPDMKVTFVKDKVTDVQ